MPRLAVSVGLLADLATLPRPVRARTAEVVSKFQQATHAGVHLEKIAGARDPRLMTIRIDQSWRGVVLAPDRGDTHVLLRVLPHDDAYRWLCRHRVSVNPAVGCIEVYDLVGVDEALPALRERATAVPDRFFADVSDADMVTVGLDARTIALARTVVDEEQLTALRAVVPGPQWDALDHLRAGFTPDDVLAEFGAPLTPVDVDDLDAAVARQGRQVFLLDGPQDWLALMERPFDMWRVFLHPAQERLVEAHFAGPAKVGGGPGTGKTVVALHRSRHLARAGLGQVLLTTFTRTLTLSLRAQLTVLDASPEVADRVDVETVDAVARRIVAADRRRRGLAVPALATDAQQCRVWAELAARHGVDAAPAFLAAEWREVVLARAVTDLPGYLRVRRAGRGARLDRAMRTSLWPVLAGFVPALEAVGLTTYEALCVQATALAADLPRPPYRHVVVDEAQDVAPWHWRLLRALVPAGPDDLFIAGDTHQRIYGHRVTLHDVGVQVRGRSSRLTLNYRTTAEILTWSLAMLAGEQVDDLDAGTESTTGYRSHLHGRAPALQGHPTDVAETDALVDTVRRWLDAGVLPGEIGVAVRIGRHGDDVAAALARAGIPVDKLSRDGRDPATVAVGTMHRMKGLEFRCMAVVRVDDATVPTLLVDPREDPAAHAVELQREKCLLFVACTRAREELAVSWTGRRSRFLPG